MIRGIFFVLVAFTCVANAADISPDQYEYKAYARNSAHKVFLAKIEVGEAQVQLARAQVVYEDNARIGQPGVSKFELQNNKLRILETSFAIDRAKYHLEEAIAFEKMYRAKIEAIQKGTDIKKSLSQINLTISKKRLELLEGLKEKLVPYLKELTSQKQDSENLLVVGALSKESWKLLVIGYDAMVDLQKINLSEIETAKSELEEAEREAN
jgi:hypothetical protein